MPTLKKSKSFTVSSQTMFVTIQDKEYEIANLLKSGLLNQNIVLLAVDDLWHEINALDLGGDDSNLLNFKNYVEQFNLTVADLGITTKKTPKDYELKQADYEQLQKEFPRYDYIKIAILDSYMKESKQTTGMYAIREILKMLTKKEVEIKDYIAVNKAQIQEIINNDKPKIIEMKAVNQIEETPEGIRLWNRLKNLSELGVNVSQNGDYYEGYGFTVTTTSVEEDTDEEWNSLIERIAAAAAAGTYPLQVGENNQTAIPEAIELVGPLSGEIAAFNLPLVPDPTPAKKPISLQTISSLVPERISELNGLKELQNKIVADNPFIKITDAKTLKKAKEAKATLLKASTAIDGTKGILANFVTHANQFIKMGKEFLNPLAQITREAHDKQAVEIITFENAEAIRIQNEQKEALAKINDRTKRLFDIPMVFNGELYTIGTLAVLPSQIEKSTDEEFQALVNQGIAIQSALSSAESAKDKQIAALEAKLKALMLLNGMTNVANAPLPPTEPVVEPAPMAESVAPPVTVTPTEIQSAAPTQTPTTPIGRFVPSKIFTEAQPNNKILNKFDLEHVSIISIDPMPEAFVKCRAYLIEGAKLAALEIKSILTDPDVTVKKSVRIDELCEILINTK